MRSKKIIYLYFILATALCGLEIYLYKNSPSTGYIAQNTYFTPPKKVPENLKVRIQVLVSDDPSPGGVQIAKAEFNGEQIPLKPRGIDGHRGQGSFQVPPGTYKLKWTVRRDRFAWPREVFHEEIVDVSPKDLWVQLSIVGEKATIE